jgi:hypothetical protein
MINTSEYGNIPATLIHRITGEIGTEEVKAGVAHLVSLLNIAVQKHNTINLIIDARGVLFTSLLAHKTWSLGFEPYRALKEKIFYCALILDDSPNARAEKELMQSERLQFFFDLDDGVAWLRGCTRLKK